MQTEAVKLTNEQVSLGEGPFWHDELEALFWFAITDNTLFAHKLDGTLLGKWAFEGNASAAAIISRDELLVATETQLLKLNIDSDEREHLVDLEVDNLVTRSNDGRCDRQGGFWIGTMGKNAEAKAGSIYRYYKGELRKLVGEITISNAICFAPDGRTAYYTDTVEGIIFALPLDEEGWPEGQKRVFADFSKEDFGSDGAIVDAEGYVWNARWGAHEVARHAPDGSVDKVVKFPVPNCSCPAFGGADLSTLFVTTAREGLSDEELSDAPGSGDVFMVETEFKGLPEERFLLG
jgi:sugar lactone lactonase YvrE